MQQYAFAVAALVSLGAAEVRAQPPLEGDRTESGRLQVFPQLAAGYAHVGSDLPGALGLGAFVGVRQKDHLGFEVGFTRAVHDGTVLNFGFIEGSRATRLAFQAALQFFIDPPQKQVQSYFLLGAGYSWAGGGGLASDIFAPLGAGLRGSLGSRFFLDGRVTYNLLLTNRSLNSDRFQVQLGGGLRI